MSFSDQSSLFNNEDLLTRQQMQQMAANDAALNLPMTLTPAFMAYNSAAQALAYNTLTKATINTVEINLTGAFDKANARFTPQQAGYYLFMARAEGLSMAAKSMLHLYLYKNGSLWKPLSDALQNSNGTDANGTNGMVMAQANGTTDYFELWLFHTDSGGSRNLSGGKHLFFFQAHLIPSRLP